jgi:class 3 adenylate cyclase/CRP-like cAMP-binding protein/tetratricopeptide (TPR) repeat protein
MTGDEMTQTSAEPAPIRCPACGDEWPPGQRFCGSCGTPLRDAHADVEERKVVTALVADIAGSTELAARLDPEDLRSVLRAFFTAMTEEIERRGGTVEKYIGDAVVAVFGVPAAHEDDPERAVRTAVAMHERLAGLNAGFVEEIGEELRMRIGVDTGEVVTATGVDREALVTGEAVNVAARFQSLAPPGGVVVGERTYRDTHHALTYRSLGDVAVKGIDRPLPAWEIASASSSSASAPGRMRLAPMVGRDEELALLELVLARVIRDGAPGLATLVGPAGIGKSRLAHEFAERAASGRPLSVVTGRCLAYGEGLTYWPLAEILKSDAVILDTDRPEEILRKAEATLGPRIPDPEEAAATVRVLLASIAVPVLPDPLAGTDPGAARETIARAWRTYFDSLASNEPVVALVEDLHWADESLLDLVEGAVARGGRPVLFVCTTRPDLMERRPMWGGGQRSSTTVSLSPLSSTDGHHLIQHLLGGLPAPEDAVRLILDRAEGNPFFGQELLRMIVDRGALVRSNGSWELVGELPEALPDTVQGVLASRIDMVPGEEKRVLQDAAVVGRVFWQGAVEHLGATGAGAALDALVERGLVVEQRGSQIEGEREFAFNHVLTQDVAYAGIPRSRRRQAHAAALEWVERVTEGRAEEFAEILAHHADRAGEAGPTARYALLAGHRSRRVFAAREAIRWYDRAVAAAEGHPGTEALVSEATLDRGEALEQLGMFPEAEADYRRALDAARAAGAGTLEARALAALAHGFWLQDRFDEGLGILDEALARARDVGATELLSRLLYTAGTLAFGMGNFGRALERHQEALDVAMANGDRAGEAFARHGLGETLYFLGPLGRSLEELEEADRLFRELGQRPMVYHNLYMVAWDRWFMGRLGDAVDGLAESAEGSREMGNLRDEAFALAGLSVWTLSGDPGRGLASVRAAVDIAVQIRTPRLELAASGMLAHALLEAGVVDEAARYLDRVVAILEELGTDFARGRSRSLQGWLAIRRGDPAAMDLFAQGREAARGVLLEDLWTAWVEVYAAEDSGHAALARESGDRLVRAAAGESPWFEAWGRYGTVLADALEDRWEAVLGSAPAITNAGVEFGDRTLEWRGAALTAKALSRLGRPAEAEGERSRAASIIEAMAATVDDPRIRMAYLSRPLAAEVVAEGSTTRLLAGVPPADVAELWAGGEARRLREGEFLFRRGDPGDGVYFIQEGGMRVSVIQDEREVELARLGPRDFVGEVAVLTDARRTADVSAIGSASVVRVSPEDFLRFLEARPLVAERLVSILGRRLEDDAGALSGSGFDDVAATLTAAVHRLARSEGRPAPALEILPVYLRDGGLRWLHPAGGASLEIEERPDQSPGDAVLEAMARRGLAAAAVHSTSWRMEGGRLLVTYLALILDPPAAPPVGLREGEVRRTDLARGSATGAPEEIRVDHVLEHALRHLAWLVEDDPAIRGLIGGTAWAGVLAEYTPEPFRSLEHPPRPPAEARAQAASS